MSQHGFSDGLAPMLCQAITWTSVDQDVWCHMMSLGHHDYRKVSNIRRTSVGNNIFDHSDVDGASPVDAAPTTSSFPT